MFQPDARFYPVFFIRHYSFWHPFHKCLIAANLLDTFLFCRISHIGRAVRSFNHFLRTKMGQEDHVKNAKKLLKGTGLDN
jgi:hypothetical protein